MLKDEDYGSAEKEPAIDIERFLPYRLTSLAESVSAALAAIYKDRFDLSRNEWRVLATLARGEALTAAEIGRRSTLDKMQTSRAVQVLVRKRDVDRKADPDDKRNRRLQLTAQGRRLYHRIAPLALEREAALLSELTPEEVDKLWNLIERLSTRAKQLIEA